MKTGGNMEDFRSPRWVPRSPRRMPDGIWQSTLTRVRGEFDEMPGLRVTEEQAQALLGLPKPASRWVLERLAKDGFLACTPQGVYMRREGGV